MSDVIAVDLGVHLRAGTPIAHRTFPDEVAGGPFVSIRLGDSGCVVALMVTDPAALTALITVATAARADLEVVIRRAADRDTAA